MKSTIYHPMESIDHLQRQVFIDEVVVNLNHMHFNKNVPAAASPSSSAAASVAMAVDDLEYHITFPAAAHPGPSPLSLSIRLNTRKPTTNNNRSDAEGGAPETAAEVPVVVLLGWYGCQDKHLSKYSKIYEDLGCITIRFLPRADILTYQSDSLRSIAAKLFEVIDEYHLESHQIILHIFSNGGCYVYRHVCNLLASAESKKKSKSAVKSAANETKSTANEAKNAVKQNGLVKENGLVEESGLSVGEESGLGEEPRKCGSRYELGLRIQGCIFDSCPAVTSPLHLFRAIAAASTSGNLVFRWVRSLLLMFAVLFAAVMEFLLGFIWSESKRVSPQSLWNTLAKDRARYPQLFLYSKADEICHYKSIKSFAEERRKCGVDVSEVCWEDSPHVKHFIIHRGEYVEQVMLFVQKCLNVDLGEVFKDAAARIDMDDGGRTYHADTHSSSSP